MRLAIVTTHPVQYNAPWFRLLGEQSGVELRVFYTWHAGTQAVQDPGFGRAIAWDLPLTEGYNFELTPPSSKVERRTFWNMDSPELVSRIKDFRPEAVLVFGWNFRSHARVMRYFHRRIPVLFRGDSTLLDQRSGFRDVARQTVLRNVYGSVDFALSVGTRNTEYFRHYGLKSEQIVLVPHAIDNARFSADEARAVEAAAALRIRAGFNEGDTVLLFAGKFEAKKCPDRLVRAFQAVSEDRTDLRLLLVGNGPLEDALKSAAENDPRIAFMPFQNQLEMPFVYRAGDVTVLPSAYNETWGLCLNESMASGRPIVASRRAGASRDLIVEQVTGFACEPDEESLLSCLQTLPSRPSLLKMGEHCRRFIAKWSFDVIVRRIVDLLSSIRDNTCEGVTP